jgi:dehydrogenase/reductase SDR family member 7B
MRKPVEGKVVWITGASSGIGRATAHAAAERGARVVLSGRRIEALDEVARECEARGAQAAAVLAFDLESPAARAEACEAAPSLLGPIDALVLNAGFTPKLRFALFLSRRLPSAYARMTARHSGIGAGGR